MAFFSVHGLHFAIQRRIFVSFTLLRTAIDEAKTWIYSPDLTLRRLLVVRYWCWSVGTLEQSCDGVHLPVRQHTWVFINRCSKCRQCTRRVPYYYHRQTGQSRPADRRTGHRKDCYHQPVYGAVRSWSSHIQGSELLFGDHAPYIPGKFLNGRVFYSIFALLIIYNICVFASVRSQFYSVRIFN